MTRVTRQAMSYGIGRTLLAGALALALALWSMALPLGALVACADDDGYTITVTEGTAGTYTAYQLFTGTFGEDGELGNIAFASATKATLLSVLQDETGTDYTAEPYSSYSDVVLANAVADAIEALDDAQGFANALAAALDEAGVSSVATATISTSGGSASLTVDATGYYLVMQSALADADEDVSLTSAILVPVDDDGAEVDAKASTPTADKSVGTDAETGAAITYNEDGTACVSYVVTGTVASNIADYSTYVYRFVDTLPAGITIAANDDGSLAGSDLTWSVSASIGESTVDITSSFAATVANAVEDDVNTSTVTWATDDVKAVLESAFADVELADGVSIADASIVLSYTVTLDADEVSALLLAASTLSDPVTNTACIVFSNNPYTSGTGTTGDDDGSDSENPEDPDDEDTGSTPADPGKLYVYNLVLSKVTSDDDGQTVALTGATFKLSADNGYASEQAVDSTDGTVSFYGLEAGVLYTLEETVTPDGYTTIDAITFTIEATYDADGETVASVAVTEASDVSNAATFAVATTTDETTGEVTAYSSTITVAVANVLGPTLPLTGQQGFVLGLVIGGLLVVLSLVAIARNRRRESV